MTKWQKIKKRWNVHFTSSVAFVAMAMIASVVHNNEDQSLMFFGIAMIFTGIGSLSNDVQEIKEKVLDQK